MSQALATTESSELELHRDGDNSEFATFYIGSQMFGIPILKVQDILTTDRIAPIPLSPLSVHGSINLRGRIVTVIDVHTCLGLKPLDVAAIDVGMPKDDERKSVTISEEQRSLVKATFAQINDNTEQFAVDFYTKLVDLGPELESVFKKDIGEKGHKLVAALKAVVSDLDSPEKIKLILADITDGDSQIKSEHYSMGAEALVWALEKSLGKAFAADVKDAWAKVYEFVANETMATNGPEATPEVKAATHTGVTIEKDHDLYTLLVDKIGDVMVVDDSIFESNPGTLDPKWRDYSLGVYRLEKELLVVLDVDKLLDSNR